MLQATMRARASESAILPAQDSAPANAALTALAHAETCRNCGCNTLRRRFKRRDLCGKCFYLFEYIKSVERWDRARPETLKNAGALRRRYGGEALPTLETMSDDAFAALRSSTVDQLLSALRTLRVREARRRGDVGVDGVAIEQKLKDILKVVQLRDRYDRVAGRFTGVSAVLNQAFSPDQCRILYSLLDDIEEQTYGQVTESHKAFEAVYQRRNADAPTMVPQEPQPPPLLSVSSADATDSLWLIDFKHRTESGETALLIVDARTQSIVGSGACASNGFDMLRQRLAEVFRTFGMPARVAVRHGQPRSALSGLDVWLIEHDVAVVPLTVLPKERLATLDSIVSRLRREVLGRTFATIDVADAAIAAWSRTANAAGRACAIPEACRAYLEQIVPFEYEPHDIIRRVQERGRVSLFGRIVRVPKALRGKDIAFCPTPRDGLFEVLFRGQRISMVHVGAVARLPSAEQPSLYPRLAPEAGERLL